VIRGGSGFNRKKTFWPFHPGWEKTTLRTRRNQGVNMKRGQVISMKGGITIRMTYRETNGSRCISDNRSSKERKGTRKKEKLFVGERDNQSHPEGREEKGKNSCEGGNG